MLIQLDPPIPVNTPKGEALCHGWRDYGVDFDLQWICFIEETGECWTFRNQDIRAVKNITMGRANLHNPHKYKGELKEWVSTLNPNE